MKKQLLLSLVVVATLLAACDKNNSVQPTTQSTTASARGTAVDGFGRDSLITQDKLPQTVLDYLTKTYAGYTFVQAAKGTDRAGATFYAVVIEQGGVRYHLHFNASGVLVPGRGGHGGPGPREANETTITQDKLPQTILDYLTANYAGYTFGMAEQAADSAGVVLYYEVAITLNSKNIFLNFDATGKLLERPKGGHGGPGGPGGHGPNGAGTSITQDKLPQTALDYLTKTYAGYTFGRAEQLTTRDGVTLYGVMITVGTTPYFLIFDANGAFVSVRTKK